MAQLIKGLVVTHINVCLMLLRLNPIIAIGTKRGRIHRVDLESMVCTRVVLH
jgi:hypothetical protein